MPDTLSTEQRSLCMARVKSKDTVPELLIRKSLFARGFRYKLHDKFLPGKPDIVFPKYRAVIFVHGCFWHKHNCSAFSWPVTRKEFWKTKINSNSERDKQHLTELNAAGWHVLIVWECALKGKRRLDLEKVTNSISQWLICGHRNKEINGKEIR
ncbi:MAG: very short patch repair endonuclease [Gammaproteobacteria bacterium]|nr:very short patch repair endonuclease [Gammaproteobacteria bacterium]MCF6362608.1 very short patch repair endonuclease [Gammaproteobacteria bacterium]